MNQSAYYGHESQLFGVEEVRLQGGKGDGMRLLQVRNGKGLEFTVSADRCADISRLIFRGENCGFFSANGYVAPAYYDDMEALRADLRGKAHPHPHDHLLEDEQRAHHHR